MDRRVFAYKVDAETRGMSGSRFMKSLPYRENGVQTNEPTFGSRALKILETIGDGFCAIDRESRIVYVNLRAAGVRIRSRESWNFSLNRGEGAHVSVEDD
jgi:hypothetical protein